VIDTQIIEGYDTSGLIEDVVIPLLADGAYGAGVSDASTAGAENLLSVASKFVQRGVSPSQVMMFLNGVDPDSSIDPDAMARFVERYGTWMGVAPHDQDIENALNRGETPGGEGTSPEYVHILDKVLSRVTGAAVFSENRGAVASSSQPAAKSRGGLFRRKAR
jgi:hypothetical protein